MYIVYVLPFKINYFALIFFHIYFKRLSYPGSYSKEEGYARVGRFIPL